jgi:hypothetical protein
LRSNTCSQKQRRSQATCESVSESIHSSPQAKNRTRSRVSHQRFPSILTVPSVNGMH